jgi:hypothetical protein
LTVLTTTLPGHELRHVDRLLDVASRLLQHLAHLTRHVSCEGFLLLDETRSRGEQQLGTFRGRHQTPRLIGLRGGLDRRVNVGGCGLLKQPDHLIVVRWVSVLEGPAGRGWNPLSGYVVVVGAHWSSLRPISINSGGCPPHGCSAIQKTSKIEKLRPLVINF